MSPTLTLRRAARSDDRENDYRFSGADQISWFWAAPADVGLVVFERFGRGSISVVLDRPAFAGSLGHPYLYGP